MRKSGVNELISTPMYEWISGSRLTILSCCIRCYMMREKNQYLHSERYGALSFECAIQRGIHMRKKIPRVEDGWLFQSESEGDPILVGTHAWYDWLEQQSSFTFV